MSLGPGTTLGSYSVTAKIGEANMGEVYRARDTKASARRRGPGCSGCPQWAVICDAVTALEKTLSAADRQALQRMIKPPVVPLCGRLSILLARRE